MSAPRLDRCLTCRAQDVDQEHADRCRITAAAHADAVAHGRGDVGIHGRMTSDLWAHVHTRTGDPEAARDVVKQVIDLGWRPVVGKVDTWTPVDAAPEGGAR